MNTELRQQFAESLAEAVVCTVDRGESITRSDVIECVQHLFEQIFAEPQWSPIATCPRGCDYVLLAAPSGYTSTPMRVHVGRWSDSKQGWVDYKSDRLTDYGPEPTLWMTIPKF